MKIQLFIFVALYVANSFQNEITPLWKDNLLTTIPHWGKEYHVSFEIKPISKQTGWTSIVHFTKGGNCCHVGERIPGVWFQPGTLALAFRTAINGQPNYAYNAKKDLPTNKFTKVVIQHLQDAKGDYYYKVFVDGKVVQSAKNTKPEAFKNVKVYAGDPWATAADAVLRNFQFTVEPEFKGNIQKGRLLQTLPVWGKEWRLRFQIRPLSAQTAWANVLHLTTGKDNAALGDRIPGVWLYPKTMRMTVYSHIGTNKAWSWTTPKNLPIIKYTNVHIEQVKDKLGKYYLKIILDGKTVKTQPQPKPTDYKNVKVYVSDPWYIHADAYMRNLHLEGISGSHYYNTL